MAQSVVTIWTDDSEDETVCEVDGEEVYRDMEGDLMEAVKAVAQRLGAKVMTDHN